MTCECRIMDLFLYRRRRSYVKGLSVRSGPIIASIDILPALKGGDSLSRRSMSRTEEDIASRVDITIMRDATLSTYPASYSEVCDTFRPRLAGARRTDSGRERFIHFLVPSPVRNRFVAEHVSEGEVRSVLDLAVRQRPREEYPEGVSGKPKGLPLALKIPAFQGHPAQRAPAAPPQERAVLLM